MTPALLLAAAALAADPADKLLETFGPGFEAMRQSGLIVVHGKPGQWRLQALDWKALGELSRRAKAVEELGAAWMKLAEGSSVAQGQRPSFMSLSELPQRRPMTPAVHALVVALGGYHAEWRALTGGSDIQPAAPPLNLFDTRWGKRFAARTHADRLEDAQPLAKPFFDQVLAQFKPDPGAREHFLQWVSERHNADAAPALERDLASGIASDDLKGWIRKYLAEERRRFQLERYRRAVKALERKGLAADFASLSAITKPFLDKPGLLSEMEAWQREPAAGGPRLKSVGLHVPQPAGAGQHEMGDVIDLTAGYWLDGLPENASVYVEETTFFENENGFWGVETRQAARRNGGPYALARRAQVPDSRPFTFRLIVSAPGGEPMSDSIQVKPGKDFETALRKLAVADQRSLLCDFKTAEAAFSDLVESLAEPARDRAQYRELHTAARHRRAYAARHAAELAKLEEAIAASRADASPDQCRYDESRTKNAIRRVRNLPAGCDKLLPDLERQLALIRRRGEDQKLFQKLYEQGHSRWKDCSFIPASESFAAALAVLDADPAARCGRTAELAGKAEHEQHAARADVIWRERHAAELAKAESEVSPQKRLGLLRPLLARMNGAAAPLCFSEQRKRTDALIAKAADALVAPEPGEVERVLPPDGALSSVVNEVSAGRRALVKDAERVQARRAEEQGPASVEPPSRKAAVKADETGRAAAESPKPPKPKVKPAPARKKKAAAKKNPRAT